MRKQVDIYTDGACSGNPGPGGWGAVLMYQGKKKELSGGEPQTTNNRMEMMAAICALEALKEPCQVQLHSDSAYLVNAFNQGWLTKWQRNGWLTAKKDAVENQDLWARLMDLAQTHQILWVKVKGHSNNQMNNRCDELAASETARQRACAEDAPSAGYCVPAMDCGRGMSPAAAASPGVPASPRPL
jgi:ribonuclease HI